MKNIIKLLKKNKFDDKTIEKWLNTKQESFFNLTPKEFLEINPKVNEKIILAYLRESLDPRSEIMGA